MINNKRLIDAFCYNNEESVLQIRLKELDPIVDYFVLVESTRSQSLLPKPLYFEENKQKFKPYLHKIVHVKITELPELSTLWTFENFQRDCISAGLEHLRISDEDIVMISDLDEIPNREVLKAAIPTLQDILVCEMNYYTYFLNLQVIGKVWNGTVITTGKKTKEMSPHPIIKLRDTISEDKLIKNAGWHCGYQGGEESVYRKYFSCVEPFSKNGIPARKEFSKIFTERAKDGGSFIFCDNLARTDLKLQKVDISTLPQSAIDYPNMLLK